MCDMDHCVLRTSLSPRNFGGRFYGCQHWSPDSDQAGKFFRWLDKDPCPRGHATAPIVWERFTRLAAEAEATKNERENARRMETKALEHKHIAKRRAEKSRVTVQTAEEKVHKYRGNCAYHEFVYLYPKTYVALLFTTGHVLYSYN